MKKIEMYEVNAKNYTKTGKIKKSAKTEYSILGEDSNKKIAEAIKRYRIIESISSPYVFTHIIMKADGKQYAIYESVLVGGQYIMTSPTKLLEALQASR